MQMASSPKFVCLFFLLITLVFSLQTYARDSHFFSRVTRNQDEDPSTTTTTATIPNTNKFFINNKESDEFEHLNKQEEQQPSFMPQTTESGYGLYGHETGLDPPSTTSTTTSLYSMDDNINNNNNNNNHFENFNNYYKNNNENSHHEKNYASELKGLSGTTYSTDADPSKFIHTNNNYNNNNNRYNNNNNYINNDEDKYYGVRHNGMQEKQGMSDTRFLENGKYYYDVNKEKNYDPNNNYMSYSNNHNNNYETNGYYGNKDEAYYGNHNNNNNFFRGNGIKGYHNQIPQEERFDFNYRP